MAKSNNLSPAVKISKKMLKKTNSGTKGPAEEMPHKIITSGKASRMETNRIIMGIEKCKIHTDNSEKQKN